jgi:hypothetical protein
MLGIPLEEERNISYHQAYIPHDHNELELRTISPFRWHMLPDWHSPHHPHLVSVLYVVTSLAYIGLWILLTLNVLSTNCLKISNLKNLLFGNKVFFKKKKKKKKNIAIWILHFPLFHQC